MATSSGTDLAHPGNFGAPIQVPALITAIAVPFHPTVGWVEKGAKASGGSSQFSLSTANLCGIFTGAITDWSDARFKVDNGNVQLGNGAINIYYRGDSSGSTFLFSNALINPVRQHCRRSRLPGMTATGNVSGVGNNSFFINVKAAGLLPANWTAASGSGAVIKDAINLNAGAISYVSPDFVLPIDTSGPKAANLQAFGSAPAKSLAPTGKNATNIVAKIKAPVNKSPNVKTGLGGSCPMGTAVGQSPDGNCAHNPLNWGVTNPAPASNAYPLGGFTFIDTYTCYAADYTAIGATSGTKLGLLPWYFGGNGTVVKTELTNNGFGAIPGGWLSAVKKLINTDTVSKINAAGTGNCAGKSGA